MNYSILPPIVIVCLDPIIHTDDHPYCGDPDCPCAEELYAEVERREQDALEQVCTHTSDCRCPWCECEAKGGI